MCGVKYLESLDGEDNVVVSPPDLLTMEDKPLKSFIENLEPVFLTKGKAGKVDTTGLSLVISCWLLNSTSFWATLTSDHNSQAIVTIFSHMIRDDGAASGRVGNGTLGG